MRQGYETTGPVLVLGSPMQKGEVAADVRIQLPLAMVTRHGLIAGATGTGKTKTLQLLAGQLSDNGVPVFVADAKGDVTGLAAPGNAADPKVQERVGTLGWTFQPKGHPIELLSLTGTLGAPIRASVHSFGPLLLGKVLDLNPTQTAMLSLCFQYCDDANLPLLDLADLRTTLNFLASDEGKDLRDQYGGMSKASVGVILRSLITLEQQGADAFFGEPAFDVADLMRTTPEGLGIISVLELSDVMDKPRLFSTFMLWMLAQLYETLPEAGDLPKPKLAFFFDEAHLLFKDASRPLMEQIELTVRLIRSKGVGVYFVTHAPTDVPDEVLGQLGNRVQHALRAFTPNDADDLRKTVRTFPHTEFYDLEETLTSLGIGEAAVTLLSARGVPTPVAATRLLPPDSLMAALQPADLQALIDAGSLRAKYLTPVDRPSAHEMISNRIEAARAVAERVDAQQEVETRWRSDLRAQAAAARATERQQAAARRAQAAVERQRRAAEREQRAAERRAASDRRAREREQARMAREGGRLIRTVFGTLFGGHR